MDQVRTSPHTMIIALIAAIALTVATWLVMTGLPGLGGDQAGSSWRNAPTTQAGSSWRNAPTNLAGSSWRSVTR